VKSNDLNSSGDNHAKEQRLLPSLASIVGRLRLRQIALLTALDEQGSLHKAADVMCMTQPAATKALHELETSIGVTLFDRSPKGLEATELGRCVIRYARLIQGDLSNMREELVNMINGQGGRLAVGTVMGAVPVVLTRSLRRLREIQPELSVEIVEDTSTRQLAMLDQGRLDLVIGRATVAPQPHLYDYAVLREEPLCIVAGIDHPLAKARTVSLQELGRQSWILYTANAPLRVLVEHEFKQAGIRIPPDVIETSSTFVTVSLLSESAMVAVMPLDIAHFFAARKMICILPTHLKSRMEPYGIVTRKNVTLSSTAKMFVNILMQQNHMP
jgi:DNA-binding transcriptional LysR family regulator